MGYGQQIKAARKIKGLTQAQLAKKCGMATITIQQYEADKREPRLEQLRRVASALEVEWTELVDSNVAAYMTIDHIREKLKTLQTPIERVSAAMKQMDNAGQSRVADYAEDILPRYRRQEPPTAPPSPQADTDTTAPPEGAEGPQEPPGEDSPE